LPLRVEITHQRFKTFGELSFGGKIRYKLPVIRLPLRVEITHQRFKIFGALSFGGKICFTIKYFNKIFEK
jgi:hypothetical protein